MAIIWRSTDFELTEIYDYEDDPAPRARFRWRTAQYGNGRCSCGRRHPAITLTTEIEEEDLIKLVRAILKYYLFKYGRMRHRGRVSKHVERRIKREVNTELRFLESWHGELTNPADNLLLDYGTRFYD